MDAQSLVIRNYPLSFRAQRGILNLLSYANAQDFSATTPASPKAPTIGALPPASMQVVPLVEMTVQLSILRENAE